MDKKWKKEIARDIIALGSIPFYFIVFIRAIIGQYQPFVYRLVIAFVVLVILGKIFKNINLYIGRGLVLAVFTLFFYQAMLYAIFVVLLWIGMLFSLNYLKVKNREIVSGVILGVISVIVGYALTALLIGN